MEDCDSASEGEGGQPVLPPDPAPQEKPSCLVPELLCEYLKIPATSTEVTLMARIRAVAQASEERRAPVTICAAIDRSGSMKGHLPLLKETLQFMVQQLRSSDRLCIITFSDEMKTELPLTAMTVSGKVQAEKAIDRVKERGHTNLSGGLLAALETLYRIAENEASPVESVLLFTDGKANVGIRTQAPLVRATSSMLGQIGRQVSVFTFGYGGEHDVDLLRAVSEAGSGLFYYIDNPDNIPQSFCDCLGGLLSVAAQNVRLSFRAAERMRLHKPLTTYTTAEREQHTEYEVTIPDIYCEEEKCILVKVTAPGDSSVTESDNLPLASCTVNYFDVLNSHPVQHRVESGVVLNPAISSPVTSDCVDDVEQHRLRCEVAEALGEANKMADRGNLTGARGSLQRAAKRVRGSRVHRQVLAVHLLETLQESLDGIQDKTTYARHGKATMQNYASSHWQQRSNTQPSSEGYVKRRKERAPTGLLVVRSTLPGAPGAAGGPPRPPSPCASTSSTGSACPYRNSHKLRILSNYAESLT
jgi:Mg-chelatase subunit ChlD